MTLAAKFTDATIESALQALHSHGYKAAAHANGSASMHIIVQDPIHAVGKGASSGMLVIVDYKPKTLQSYGQARQFIEARS